MSLHALEGGRATAREPAIMAAALFRLLGHARGVWQHGPADDEPGAYPGARFVVAEDDLRKHFEGEGALGITGCTDGRTGRWFAVDVDARWPERWPCYAAVLKRRKLAGAALLTDGSRPEGSGKVVVFFEHALPVRDLRRLARDVDLEARADPRFGHVEKPSHVELWPKVGGARHEGGVLRIGGRHATRGLRLERLFGVDGGDIDLRAIRPSRVHAIPSSGEPKPIAKSAPHRFVAAWRNGGLPEHLLAAGHHAINRAVYRLACEAYRLHGEAGADLLKTWLVDITKATPKLAAWSSPTTADTRDPLGWGTSGAGAWARVLEARGGASATLLPSAPVGGCNVACSAAETVVALLEQYVEAKGLHPGAFEVSYRQIAGWIGEPDPKKAWRIVQRAVKAGKLSIVHRGVQGEKGLKTIYGLVRSRLTATAVVSRAAKVLARREIAMQAHAQAKWQAATDRTGDPVRRRTKRAALAREVVQGRGVFEGRRTIVVLDASPPPSEPGARDGGGGPTATAVPDVDLMAYARERLARSGSEPPT